MRVLIDYRPALRERSGVGEYTHELARALLAIPSPPNGHRPLDLTLFSSSWKDRLAVGADLRGASTIDRRVPVHLLNLAWHRFDWPPAETITGHSFDVVHSMHPLLLPARRAAQIVTVHDLYFMSHPERTAAEIRRDYASLARAHAHRADAVIAVSQFTAGEAQRLLGLPADRISVCSPGAPAWRPRGQPPADGYVLFFGTLEPRKNVGLLLDAYASLAGRRDLPRLVLAGKATDEARPWLERLTRAPLRGIVEHAGYVAPDRRRALYEGAQCLVQPSLEEGFGIPVLEAMTLGVPVIATNRGALPEVLGDAGTIVSAEDPHDLAAAIDRMVHDTAYAASCAARGIERARRFSWEQTARAVCDTYRRAIERRCG